VISQQSTAEIQLVFINSLGDTADVKKFIEKISAVAGDIKQRFYSPTTFTIQFVFDCCSQIAQLQTVCEGGDGNRLEESNSSMGST